MATAKFIKRALFGGAIGASVGFLGATAGHRRAGTEEGALGGALLASISPIIAIRASRAVRAKKATVMRGVKPLTRKNIKVVFRRIRGRIVPVRVKK